MPDDPTTGVPSTASAESAASPSSGAGGFLLGAQPESSVDGEQLFRQAVAAPPTPAPTSPPSGSPPPPPGIDNVTLCRILGLAAVGLGVLAFLSTREFPFPVILIVGGLILAFYIGSPARLKRDQIVDRWDLLIDGAAGRREEVMQGTIARIERQHLPQIQHEYRELAASLLRSATRPFVVVTHLGNGRIAPYRMHVSVRDYGTNLQTSWYLSYHRSFFEKLVPNPLMKLDLFDEQDLRAYATTVHHAFLDAVTELLVSLGKDTASLERTSKGFLGIS
jgi:hypothetical protein